MPVYALTITRTDDPSLNNTSIISTAEANSARTAFDYAASQITARYSDNIQINIILQAVAGTSTLGGSSTALDGFFSYTTIRNALIADAKSTDDATAVASLPVNDPTGAQPGSGWFTTRAQSKSLGLLASDAVNDGTFTFGAGFSYTFDPANRAVSGKIDFIGVCIHEITEIMGRIPELGGNLGDGGPDYLLYDLFRYTAPGARGLTNGNGVYFSINGGMTNRKNYNFPNGNGSDPQDWASGANDACNAFSNTSAQNDFTAVDIQVLDVIGYNLVIPPTVTSPTSTAITTITATLGGNVTNDGANVAADGAANFTERGVVYAITATNNNPTIGGTGVTKVTTGLSSDNLGVFTLSVSGLTPGTGYSFKAYAVNSLDTITAGQGTSYTTVATFTTLSNFTWSPGGNGTWAVGTGGWDLGNWVDGNNAIIGKGNDTAGTVTISSTVTPNLITFNAPQAGTAYTLIVNGTLAGSGTTLVTSGATIRGTSGTINRTLQTSSTGIIWPGSSLLGYSVPSGGENLTIGGLSMVTGSKLKIALNAGSTTSTQKLTVTGSTCVVAGTLSLGIPAGAASGNAYTIISSSLNNLSGTFSTVILNGTTITGTSPIHVIYSTSAVTVMITGAVTPVKIDALQAQAIGAGVNATWTAVSEFKNAGFNVYRRALGESGWTRANAALIPGRITHPDEKQYAFHDWAPPGIYDYKLESVGISNEREFFLPENGPVNVDWNSRLSNSGDVTRDVVESATSSIAQEASVTKTVEVSARFATLDPDNFAGFVADAPVPSPTAATPLEVNFKSDREPRVATNTSQPGAIGRSLFEVNSAAPKNVSIEQPSAVSPLHPFTPSALQSQSPAAPSSCHLVTPSPCQNAVAGIRWFSGATPAASNTGYSAAKLVYAAPGVMLLPQLSMPAGYDIHHVALQREGRNFAALALTPSGLLLYLPGYQDDYTDKDAVFIRRIAGHTAVGPNANAAGLFASSAPVNVTSPATARTDYHDVYFDFGLKDYNAAPWFSGQYLTQGTTQNFTLNAPLPASGPAALTINLWSLTENAAVVPDHGLQVLVNNQPVGQQYWSGGNKPVQLSFTIPAGALVDGANTISLVTPSIAGLDASTQIALLHSLTLNYTRLLDGSQSFSIISTSAAPPMPQMYELYNVPAAGAYVVDARFTDRAALVCVETQAQPDGTLHLRFAAGGGGGGQFLVVPKGREHSPLSLALRQVMPVRLNGTYLATGPSQFGAGVQPLLAARAKEGIRGTYADQEQLFDNYNFGRYGPAGIQKAVRSLRPQYLLLLGRTTYDYRNYEGLNVDPLCPALLVATSSWAQTTSDSMFGDLGRGYPEVAVGRLPVLTPGDLAVTVSRILSYKGLPPGGSGARVHAVADLADPEAGDFAAQLEEIRSTHPDVSWQPNYFGITHQTGDEVHAAMSSAANGGADLILYAGHGNASRLGKTNPRILDNVSVSDWKGNVVFIQATCTANWAANNSSTYKSIAMTALTQPGGGISASIASSTYMNSETAAAFVNQLLKNAQAAPETRWGAALMRTQAWAFKLSGSSSYYTDLCNTEQIFGDPAMPVFARSGGPAQTSDNAPGRN